MRREEKVTRTIEREYFQLNKKLFEELSNKTNEEYEKSLKNKTNEQKESYIHLSYVIKTKEKEIESGNFERVLGQWDPKNFTEFNIYFSTSDKTIRVRISSYSSKGFAVTVSGIDSTWVGGLKTAFQEIADRYKSKNEFFYKRSVCTIFLLVPSVFGLIMLAPRYLNTDASESILNSILGMILIATCSYWIFLFRWFFPKIELENSDKAKIRKYILSILGIVITIVIAVFQIQ